MAVRANRVLPYGNLDVYNQENEKELKGVYRKWANAYDHDNDNVLGTVSQPLSVRMFQTYVANKDCKILDVGCGTGLVGAELAKAGFTNYDGVDVSYENHRAYNRQRLEGVGNKERRLYD